MRKLLFLAVLGGVVYGLRRMYEDANRGSYGERRDEDLNPESRDRDRGENPPTTEDDRLDEALRESFPASDPPSIRPG
jgi:hypothetical protein